MLVWVTLFGGLVVLAVGSLAVMRVDRRWRSTRLQCCRCLDIWFSAATMCSRCGARGRPYDWSADRFAGFPTHDWQGYLDTGPIPRVALPPFGAPITGIPRQRRPSGHETLDRTGTHRRAG